MELVKLHVGNLGSGVPRHRDAVAGSHRGIRCIAVHLPGTSAGQQHGPRPHPRHLAVAIEQPNPGNGSVLDHQVGGRGPLQQRDVGDGPRVAQQRPPDLRPGSIPVRVQNAIAAVRALARQHQLSRLAVEIRAPAQQFLDAQRPFLHQHPRRFAVHQAVAGVHRIVQMQRDVFLAAHRNGDSPLRIIGVRFVERFFRHHQHPGPLASLLAGVEHPGSVRSQANRGAQPRDPRAHNNEVRLLDCNHELSGYRIFEAGGTMQPCSARLFARRRGYASKSTSIGRISGISHASSSWCAGCAL